MSIEPGTRLGPYKILACIGSGGMGDVYRARHAKLGRDVAIKVLPDVLASEDFLARFEREAQAVAALSHPNILAIHDFVSEEDISYTVTELLEGETLGDRLVEGALSTDETLDLAIQICRGLEAAHDKRIIHRDLKPDNIFLTHNQGTKILDFGIAKVIDPASASGKQASTPQSHTMPGTVLGTLGYMSPEQVRGYDTDHRTDLFSLGVILYEMITGERAFERDTSADSISAILNDEPPQLMSDETDIPPLFRHILVRCLQKERDMRFQSASELRLALERLSGTAIEQERQAPSVGPDSSIAVLPFKDMSSEKDQDYFCEGVAEEILNALSQVKGLRVAARSSAFQLGDQSSDARNVGDALNVGHFLEGSVRTSGSKLRVTAQLVNTRDGYQVWSDRYDREMEDVFAIQEEIASNIVQALRPKLAGVSQELPSVKRQTVDLAAYHLYLKGRFAFEKRDQGGPHKAIPFFEQAVETDGTYALAHAGLGDCYTVLGLYGLIPPALAYEKAHTAIFKALEAEDDLAEAHTTLARFLLVCEGSWEACEKEFVRSLELNPSDVQAWCWYSLFLGLTGRHQEAVSKIIRAQELDPLSAYPHAVAGLTYLFAGETEKAIETCDKALELEPNHPVALYFLGIAYCLAGHHQQSIEVLLRAVELTGRASFCVAFLAWANGKAGRKREANSLLSELQERAESEYVAPVFLASACSGLGDVDQAIDYLKQFENERSPFHVWLGFPVFDNLRSEPRFRDLLQRLGFPGGSWL